jgi:hypothetical protein
MAVVGESAMFSKMNNLTNFIAPRNISVDISFKGDIALTVDSLMSIINNLATVTTPKTLLLDQVNIDKLTEEQLNVAINKGWVVEVVEQ